MGIWRKISVVLGMAVLVLSTTAGRPASAAFLHEHPDHGPAPLPAADGPQATKRVGAFLRIAIPSDSAPAHADRAPSLEAFTRRLNRELPGEPAGLYLGSQTALHVVGQPAGDPAYVSSVPGTVTLFRLAVEAGTVGLLAHHEAGGAAFDDLLPGDTIWLTYGDGRAEAFAVSEVQRYHAQEASNPYSDFVDLATGERLSAAELFQRVYGSGHGLVLQTCLSHETSLTWGRLFVLAEPLG